MPLLYRLQHMTLLYSTHCNTWCNTWPSCNTWLCSITLLYSATRDATHDFALFISISTHDFALWLCSMTLLYDFALWLCSTVQHMTLLCLLQHMNLLYAFALSIATHDHHATHDFALSIATHDFALWLCSIHIYFNTWLCSMTLLYRLQHMMQHMTLLYDFALQCNTWLCSIDCNT